MNAQAPVSPPKHLVTDHVTKTVTDLETGKVYPLRFSPPPPPKK